VQSPLLPHPLFDGVGGCFSLLSLPTTNTPAVSANELAIFYLCQNKAAGLITIIYLCAGLAGELTCRRISGTTVILYVIYAMPHVSKRKANK
jgi:hypothetical protein